MIDPPRKRFSCEVLEALHDASAKVLQSVMLPHLLSFNSVRCSYAFSSSSDKKGADDIICEVLVSDYHLG